MSPEEYRRHAARIAERAMSEPVPLPTLIAETLGQRGASQGRQAPTPHSPRPSVRKWLAGILRGAVGRIQRLDPHVAPPTLGVWEPRVDKGEIVYARTERHKAVWRKWAERESFRVTRSTPRRVVFLGESAARGYLYDPSYTAAGVLQQMLSKVPGFGDTELIDLAATDCPPARLVDLLQATSTVLAPDAIVVFGGNNWSLDNDWMPDSVSIDPALRSAVADSIRSSGTFAGAREPLLAAYRARVRSFVDVMRETSTRSKVPVIMVVPEYNLADYVSDHGRDRVPWLPDGGNSAWPRLLDQARAALSSGDLARARSLAQHLVRLDHGLSAASLTVLAAACVRSGAVDEARAYFEQAKDCGLFPGANPSNGPRPLTVVQQTLRQECARGGIPVVDVPRLLAQEQPDRLPDRRFFLDYCHLTAEGIQLVMAATAKHVVHAVTGTDADGSQLLASAPAPTPETEGSALFLAAIHNAHWGQPEEMILRQCQMAIQANPRLAMAMMSYVDCYGRPAGALCREYGNLLAASPEIDRYIGMKQVRMDIRLMRNMVAACDTVRSGSSQGFMDGVVAEHAITETRSSLLGALVQPARERRSTPRAYFESSQSVSRFILTCDGRHRIRLKMTLRVPGPVRPDVRVGVAVDGFIFESIAPSADWTHHTLSIPESLTTRGVRELSLQWPDVAQDGNGAILRAAARFATGSPDVLEYPVYGALYVLDAEGLPMAAESRDGSPTSESHDET